MLKTEQQINETSQFLQTAVWLTPLNLNEEREKFLANPSFNPQIQYPELPMLMLENHLHQLLQTPNKKDPNTLEEWVLGRRKHELELTILMLLNRDNEDYGMNSCQLYQCTFDDQTLVQAKKDAASPLPFVSNENKTTAEIIEGITQYLREYGITDWLVELSEQTDFYFRVKANQKRILIGKRFNWDFTNFDCMLAHEIDGHVLRAVNSAKQSNPLLQKPLPFYIKTEEGLASFLGDYHSSTAEINRKHHAIKYLAGHLAQTASFKEVFEFFMASGFTEDLAFQRTFRLKRGLSDTGRAGCFGKEAMYYEGMIEVKKYIDNDGDIEKLYSAKIGLADLPYVEIPNEVLIPDRLQKYLNKINRID